MVSHIKTGFLKGAGADVHVELGFLPDYVKVVNAMGTDPKSYEAFLGHPVLKFDDGDAGEIKPGDWLVSSGDGMGRVRYVVLESGSWATGGGAAGWILFEKQDFVGGWDNNDVISRDGVNVGDAVDSTDNAISLDTAAAASEAISLYHGATDAARGFTLAASIAVSGEILHYVAVVEG